MIIVEGPDNGGKSTLIKQLIELDPGLRILKRKRFDRHKDQTIGTSYLQELIPEDGDRVAHGYAIADRFFASECIYGSLFRNGCRMTAAEHRAVRNMLMAYGTVLVFCRPPDDTITETWKERKQLYDRDPLVVAQEYDARLYSIFDGAAEVGFDYDWTNELADGMRQTIVDTHQQIQEERCAALTWWGANPYGIGQLVDPDVVFLGESASPRAKVPVPFVAGPAADFLSKSLLKVRKVIGHDQFYITNAEKGTDKDTAVLRHELTQLGKVRAIVCLGKVAQEMYEYVQDDLPSVWERTKVITIPHPMYWRRFRWKERHQYAQMLIEQLEPLYREQPA